MWFVFFLQSIRQELVHLGDAGGDAEVDGSVADLDDETADDVRVDLGSFVRGVWPGVKCEDWEKRTVLVTLSFWPASM